MICLTIGKASSVALRHASSNQVARRATDILDQGHATAFYLHPVFKVWASHGYLTRPSGKTTKWLWDPDPLDTCYCGGPRRYGSCCASAIRQYSMAELQQCLDETLQQSDFAEAEG